MAGTIVADTLSDGAGNTTAMDNAIYGSAKAWVNFNGVTTTTIRASYNVSSVTRNSTGDYTVNMTNALSDANYAYNVSVGGGGASAGYQLNLNTTSGGADSPPTTTSFRFATSAPGVAYYDEKYINVILVR